MKIKFKYTTILLVSFSKFLNICDDVIINIIKMFISIDLLRNRLFFRLNFLNL